MNILLQDSGDGGELVIESGDIKADETLLTALYLSLFTGNAFYNVYENYKTDKEFENCLSLPITALNLRKTEQAAKNLTDWLIEEGLAESVDISATGDINEKQNVSITITEPSGAVSVYGIIWDNERRILKRM